MHCMAMDDLGDGPKRHFLSSLCLLLLLPLLSQLPNTERKLRAGQLCLRSLLLWASPSLLPFPSVPRNCFIFIGGALLLKSGGMFYMLLGPAILLGTMLCALPLGAQVWALSISGRSRLPLPGATTHFLLL